MTKTRSKIETVPASWTVPNAFRACTTTRVGGVSEPPFASLNLGDHVGDMPKSVKKNRKIALASLGKPGEPIWLDQEHGARVAEVSSHTAGSALTADASVTREYDCVLAIMTADCLPVVMCSPEHDVIAAVHGGWRGLAADILQHTLLAMDCPPDSVHVWLGPAIGPTAFEVGREVRERFVAQDPEMARCFRAADERFMADIYAIARRSLATLGVTSVCGGEHCTYFDQERFFSYRRDGQTGRMATFAWMAA